MSTEICLKGSLNPIQLTNPTKMFVFPIQFRRPIILTTGGEDSAPEPADILRVFALSNFLTGYCPVMVMSSVCHNSIFQLLPLQ